MAREFKTYFKEDIPHKKKWSELTLMEKQKRFNDKRNKSLQKSLEKKKESGDSAKLEKWYMDIHKKYNFKCFETGKELSFNKSHSHHCLPKRKSSGGVPYYQFDIRNGILLSTSIHHQIEYGTQSQKDKLKCYPEILKIQISLLTECGLDVKADELRTELHRVNTIKIASETKG